jgi:hypothetical protein
LASAPERVKSARFKELFDLRENQLILNPRITIEVLFTKIVPLEDIFRKCPEERTIEVCKELLKRGTKSLAEMKAQHANNWPDAFYKLVALPYINKIVV